MATVTRTHKGLAVWRGQQAEVSGITCFQIGDRFYAWDTGFQYEILDPGIGWEVVSRGLPTPRGTSAEELREAY